MIWNLVGTYAQNALVREAIDRCDFDFSKLTPSLTREGKQQIRVEWADLSRYSSTDENAEGQHDHVHDGDAVAHPVERVVNGRKRVLGLFYLPPYTKVVLDQSLVNHQLLAQEVFLAEGAHAVDYHFMNTPEQASKEMRRRFVNSLHTQQLAEGADTRDGVAFNLDGHTCSWFDVNTYAMWCGEAFMEGFIEATSDVPVTINLGHPVGPEDRQVIRDFLGIEPWPAPLPPAPEPEPTPEPEPEPAPVPEEPVSDEVDSNLATALRRFFGTKTGAKSPRYLRDAGQAWLARRK